MKGPLLIDGRGMSSGGTGIARYTRSLAASLARRDLSQLRVLCFRSEREAYRALGLRSWPLPSGRLFRPWQLPPVDVLHSTDFRALYRRGAKLIVTVHDLCPLHFPSDYPDALVSEMSNRLTRQMDSVSLVICISRTTEDALLRSYPGYRGRTAVVHHGLDGNWFSQPQPQSAGSVLRALRVTPPYLLHLGALVPRKNLAVLVRAWAELRRDHPNLGLVLAGPSATKWKSSRQEILKEVAGRPDLRRDLRLPGYVDDLQARTLTSCATAYVCASKCEGFALPVLEAMAAGVPVVASPLAAIREVAGDTIVYAASNEPMDIASAVAQAIGPTRTERVTRARSHAKKFSWDQCAKETLLCYRRLTP